MKSMAPRRAFAEFQPSFSRLQHVLFGLRPRWILHLCRSPSNHSDGYAFSVDQPNCFAHHALIPKPFMQFAGKVYFATRALRASRADPKAASVCAARSTGTPSLRSRIRRQVSFTAPPPLEKMRRGEGAPSSVRRA